MHIIEKQEDMNSAECRKKLGMMTAREWTKFAKEGNGFNCEVTHSFTSDPTKDLPAPICNRILNEDIKGVADAISMDTDYEDIISDKDTMHAVFGDRADGANILLG